MRKLLVFIGLNFLNAGRSNKKNNNNNNHNIIDFTEQFLEYKDKRWNGFIYVDFEYSGNINKKLLFKAIEKCKNKKDLERALSKFHFEFVDIVFDGKVYKIIIQESLFIHNVEFRFLYTCKDKIVEKIYKKNSLLARNYFSKTGLPSLFDQHKVQINTKDIKKALDNLKIYFKNSGYNSVSVDYKILKDNDNKNIIVFDIVLDGRKNIQFDVDIKDKFVRRSFLASLKVWMFDKYNIFERFYFFDIKNLFNISHGLNSSFKDRNYLSVKLDYFYDDIKKIVYFDIQHAHKFPIVLEKISYNDSISLKLDEKVYDKINGLLSKDYNLSLLKSKIKNILLTYYFGYDYDFVISHVCKKDKVYISILINTKKNTNKKILKKINIYGNIDYIAECHLNYILPFKVGDLVFVDDVVNLKNNVYLLNKDDIKITHNVIKDGLELDVYFLKQYSLVDYINSLSVQDKMVSIGGGQNLIKGSLWDFGGKIDFPVSLFWGEGKSSLNINIQQYLFEGSSFNLGFNLTSQINNLYIDFFPFKYVYTYLNTNKSTISYRYNFSYLIQDFDLRFIFRPIWKWERDKLLQGALGLQNTMSFTKELDFFKWLSLININVSKFFQNTNTELSSLYDFDVDWIYTRSLNISQDFDLNKSFSFLVLQRIDCEIFPSLADIFFAGYFLGGFDVSEFKVRNNCLVVGVQTPLFYIGWKWVLLNNGTQAKDGFLFGINFNN